MAIYELEERVYLDAAAVADVLEATEIMDAEQQAAEDAENIENSADDSSFDTDFVGDADGVDTDEISAYSDLVDDIVINGFDLNVDTVLASDIDDAYDFILGDEHADSLSADVDSHDNEIYIIDSAIDDAGDIIDAIPDNATVVHLAEGEGVSKITEIVNENSDIDSVHIVSQGNYAQIILGDNVITKDNILEFQDDFSSWQDNLSSDADILFYGCDIAKEAQGQEVLGHIADWTGADIAASSDITGGELTSQDSAFVITGDWNLEYSTGTIETDVLYVDNYNHHLETYTVTDITDDGDIADEGSLSWAIAQSNSTTSLDDTITFSLDSGDTVTVSGILTVSDDVTIEGNGCVVAFEGDDSGFVFDDANSDIQISITVKDINIVDAYGNTSADTEESDTEESVNLIRNSENLTIVNTNIDDIGYVYAHVPSIVENPKVLLVSSILNDVDDLVAAAKDNVIVLEYDPQSTTMDQLSTMVENALNGRKASSVAFANHSTAGNEFYLTDSEIISLDSTLSDSDQHEFWRDIASNIKEDGRIDLLACNLAEGTAGELIISTLESIAGINVAASTDETGNSENGGNWILETDDINSEEYFNSETIKYYSELMGSVLGPVSVANIGTETDNTRSVVLGDVNSDGHLDVVAGNDSYNKLYLGRGDGTFEAALKIGTETDSTNSVVLGDVNSDGHLDVVAGNNGQTNKLYLGKGDGTFEAALNISTEKDNTRSVVLGDVNSDGHLDVVAGKSSYNKLYLGNGNGTFEAALNIGTETDSTNSVVLGDVNSDGHLDVVAGNMFATNKFYLGNGNGTFEAGVNIGTETDDTASVVLGDVNSDGLLDVVAGNLGQTNKLYLGKRDGTFEAGVDIGTETDYTQSVVLGDVNSDGHLDVVAGNMYATNKLYLGKGDGTFEAGVNIGTETDNTYSVVLGDVNSDGLLDVVAGNSGQTNKLYSFLTTVSIGTETDDTWQVVLGDVNSDGFLDVVAGNMYATNKLYLGKGDGTFETGVNIGTETDNTYSVVLGDVNSDGHLDVVAGNNGQTNKLYLGKGNGTFEAASEIGTETDSTWSVVLGDVNSDGLLDVVAGNLGQTNKLYLAKVDGTFEAALNIGTEAVYTYSVVLGDVNSDGHLDVVAGNASQTNKLYLGRGDGTFKAGVNIGTETDSTASVVLGDVNSDGLLDVVAGNYGQTNKLYLGKVDGTFEAALNIGTETDNTWQVVLADVNNDGLLDVVAGNSYQTNKLYLGKGNGTFEAASDIGTETDSTRSVVLADVNNDGLLDVVAGNLGYNKLYFLNLNGTFEAASDIGTVTDLTNSVVLGDVNSDGLLDVVAGNNGQTNKLYLGKSDGTFEAAVNIGTETDKTYSVVLADVNSDGLLDVVAGNADQTNKLYLGKRDGTFEAAVNIGTETDKTLSVVLADVNSDGLLDVVAGNAGQTNKLYLGKRDGTFEEGVNIGTETDDTTSVVLGDVNSDGLLDVVAGNYSQTQTNKLYLGKRDGTFEAGVDIGTETDNTRSVVLGDVNSDGLLDVVAGNAGQTNKLYLGKRDGTFEAALNIGTETDDTWQVVLGDVNNDGLLDVVAGNAGQTNKLYLGKRDGTFEAASDIGTETDRTRSVVLGDVNSDGLLDVVAGNYNATNKLYLQYNVAPIEEYYYKADFDGGDWYGTETWLRSMTGGDAGSYLITHVAPTVDNSVEVTIINGATVSASSSVEIDNMTVAYGGTLSLIGGTYTVLNGDGTDLTADGDISIGGAAVLLINSGAVVDSNGSFTSTGGVSFDDETAEAADNGTLTIAASEASFGSFTAGSGTVTYDGNAAQTLAAETYNNLTINKTNTTDTVTLASGTANVSGDLSITNGILNASSNEINVTGSTTGAGELEIGTGTVDVDGTYNVTGNTTFTGAGNLKLGGTVTSFGTLTDTMGTVTYDGNSAQSLLEDTYYNLTINKTNTTDTVTLASGTADVNGNLTISKGVFSTENLDVEGTTSFSSTEDASKLVLTGTSVSFGTLDAQKGMVEYGGSAVQTLVADIYYDLTINKTNTTDTVTLASGTADVNGNLTISKGVFSTANLDVEGTTSFSSTEDASKLVLTGTSVSFGTLVAGSGTVTYDRAGAQTIAAGTYYNVAFSGGGSKTLLGVLDVGNDFTINSDSVVDSGNFDITVGGDWINNAGTAGFTAGSGTVTFDGTSAQGIASATFYNLAFSGGGTKTLLGVLDVGNDFTINSDSVVDSGNFDITVGGDWINNAGTAGFTAGSGTVTFDGSGDSQILGSTNFNNFSCTTAGKGIIFDTAGTQTIGDTFTLTGAEGEGNLITVSSTNAGDQADINVAASSVSYVEVVDSNNTGTLIQTTKSEDLGNNNGWQFALYYKTIDTGGALTWSTESDWLVSDDLLSWSEAEAAPDADNALTIQIQSNANVSVTSDVTADEVVVDSGGTLTLTGGVFTVADGDETDLTANGDISVVGSGTLLINSGAAVDSNGLFSSDGTVSFADDGQLSLAAENATLGTLLAGSGTVIYDREGLQTIYGAEYNNLTVGGSGVKSIVDDITIAGTDLIDGSAQIGLFVTGCSIETRTYNGTDTATVIFGSITSNNSFSSYTDFSIEAGSALFDTPDAGVGKTVTVGAFSTTGADASKYVINNNDFFTVGNIDQRVLGVGGSFTTAASKVYDADATIAADTSGVTFSNVVGSDDVSSSVGVGTFDSGSNVVTDGTVNLTSLTLTGTSSGNYTYSDLSGVAAATASITRKSVDLTGERAYDGTAVLNAGIFTISGEVGSETLTLTGAGSMADKNVGEDKAVSSLGTLTLGDGTNGGLASNYTLSGGTDVVTVTEKSVTLTGSFTAADKTYNGSTETLILTSSLGLDGVETGDTVNISTETAAFDTANAGTGKTVDVTVSISGADSGNYAVSYTGAPTAAATVYQKSVDISGSRTYDGTAVADSTDLEVTGEVSGEELGLSGSGLMFSKNVGVDKTVYNQNLTLVDGDGGLASNYTLSNAVITLTVTCADVTFSTSDVSKTYDGTTDADGTVTIVSGEIFDGDTASGGTFAYANANVSTGKTVTVSGVTVDDGNGGSNYSVSYEDNTSSEITAAVISLSGTRTYDGTTSVASGSLVMSGLVGSETLTLSGSGVMTDKNVGTGKSFTSGTLALGDGTNDGLASNYTLTGGTDTVDITTASISITSSDVSKTYDGDTTADGTAVLASGSLYGTDSISGGTFTFDSSNVGTGMTVAVSGVTVNDDNSGSNYSVTYVDNTSSEITAAVISLSGTRTYNGTVYVSSGDLEMSGLVGDETLTLTGTGSMADKNVGIGKTFSLGTLVLGDGDNGGYASNYTLTGGTDTVDITTASISITSSDVSKTYDGDTTADGTAELASGSLYGTDSISGGTFTFDSSNVGTGMTVAVSGVTVNDDNSGSNYSVTYVDNTSSEITAAVISLSGSREYNGETTVDAGILALSGLVGDETLTLTGTGLMADKNIGAGKSFTSGTLELGDGTNDGLASNYTLTGGTDTVDITAKALTFSGSFTAAGKVYDGSNETVILTNSISLVGGVAGDDVSVNGYYAEFADKNAGTGKSVVLDQDLMSLSGTDSGNYSLSFSGAPTTTATIAQRSLDISASRTYDGTSTLESDTFVIDSGLVGNETLVFSGSALMYNKDAGTDKYVYLDSLVLGDGTNDGLAANYTLDEGEHTADISKATISITTSDVSKTYDGETTADGTAVLASGILYGSDYLSGGTFTFDNKNVGTDKTVTVSGVTINDGNSGNNYTMSGYVDNTSSEILAKDITVSGTRSYDGTADFESTILSMSGLVSGESLSLTGTGTVSSIHVSEGAQTIDVTGLTLGDSGSFLASNYELVSGGTGTITAVELTVDLTNTGITKVYNGTSDAPTGFSPSYSLSGFVSGDTDASISNNGISYNSANVAEADTLTVSGLSISSVSGSLGSAATDYSLDTATLSKDASITARDVTVSGTRSYDGTADFESTILSMSGLVSGESLSLTGTGTVSSIHVSEGAQTIDVTGLTLGDSGSSLASNYELVSGGTGTITAVELTVDLTNTGITKVYNGTSDAPTGFSPSYSLSGFVSGDTDAAISNSGISYNSANVAEADTLTVSGLSISSISGSLGSAATDYSLDTATLSKDASITAKPLSVTADAVDKVYGISLSNESGYTGFSSSGLVAGDSIDSVTVVYTDGADAADPVAVYSGAVEVSNAVGGVFTASNYEITYVSGDLTVVALSDSYFRSVAGVVDWNDVTSWEVSADGTNWYAAPATPFASEAGAVNIQTGSSVSVTEALSIDQTTVNGTLSVSGAELTVVNGSETDLTVNAGGTLSVDSESTLVIGGGSAVDNDGTFSSAGTVTFINGTNDGILYNSSSTISFGTLTAGSGEVVYDGSGAQVITSGDYFDLSATGSGVKTLSGNISAGNDLSVGSGSGLTLGTETVTVSGSTLIEGTLILGSRAVLDNNGTFSVVDGVLNNSGKIFAAGTVTIDIAEGESTSLGGRFIYDGAESQDVEDSIDYNQLYFSGGGNKTVTDDITVSSYLWVAPDAILNISSGTLTSEFYTYVSSGLTVAEGAVLDNNGTFTVAGGVLNNSGRIFAGGTVTIDIAEGESTSLGGRFIYDGAESQDVEDSIDYNQLYFEGGGNKTVTDDITVSSYLWVAPDATLNISSGTLTSEFYTYVSSGLTVAEGAVLDNNGTFTVDGGVLNNSGRIFAGGTVTIDIAEGESTSLGGRFIYDGAESQDVEDSIDYNQLYFAGGGNKTVTDDITVSSYLWVAPDATLNISSGTLTSEFYTYVSSGLTVAEGAVLDNNGTFTVDGGVLNNSGRIFAAGTVTIDIAEGESTSLGGRFIYDGAESQDVEDSIDYNQLYFEGSGNKTVTDDITVSSYLWVAPDAILNISSGTLTSEFYTYVSSGLTVAEGAVLDNNGTFTVDGGVLNNSGTIYNAGTVAITLAEGESTRIGGDFVYDKAGEQTIDAGVDYTALYTAGSGDKILDGDVTVEEVLNIGSNANVNLNGNVLSISSDGGVIAGMNNNYITNNSVDGGLRKYITADGFNTFEVGTSSGYTPLVLAVSGAAYDDGAYIQVNSVASALDGIVEASSHLNRYWKVDVNGVNGSTSEMFNATYLQGDVSGTESSIYGYEKNVDGTWTKFKQVNQYYHNFQGISSSIMEEGTQYITGAQTIAMNEIDEALVDIIDMDLSDMQIEFNDVHPLLKTELDIAIEETIMA